MYSLPNKKGEPIPIKKVRVSVEMGNAQQLKKAIKQFVNPRNNHHALIFAEENGTYNFNIESFWNVVKRSQKNEEIFQIPKGFFNTTLIEVFERNDMFLLGLSDIEFQNNMYNVNFLSKYLYKTEVITSTNNGRSPLFEFRHHSESTQNRDYYPHYVRITSLGEGKNGWLTQNPIKIKILTTGKIEKI